MNAPTSTRIVTLRLAGHPDEYALLDTAGLTLLNALNHIRPSLPAPLGDAFAASSPWWRNRRALGWCGSW